MAHAKCPTCDRRIELSEKHFGRKVQCSCGKVLRIPARNPSSSQSPSSQAASSAPIQFSCPTCMTLLEVGGEMAGKLSACPCGTEITVPSSTDVANDPMFADPDPLTDPFSNPYTAGSQTALTSSVPSYTNQSYANAPSQASSGQKRKKEKSSLFEGEVIGGIAMMVGATVWFVVGLFLGYIFFYPPILFVIGLVGVIKGLLD